MRSNQKKVRHFMGFLTYIVYHLFCFIVNISGNSYDGLKLFQEVFPLNDQSLSPTVPDQEVFQRVWKRVMEGHENQPSPMETISAPSTPAMPSFTLPERWVDGDMSLSYLESLTRQEPTPTDQPESDLPMMEMEPVGDSLCTARLRQQTLEALEAWQYYRHLARRTRGSSARILAGLASDQHQLARKLAAAYFLNSGVRYWPSEQLPTPVIPSYWGALRQRHQMEQQAELNYRMSGSEANEPTLSEMYRELSDSCRSHCRQLRMLLEQSCP